LLVGGRIAQEPAANTPPFKPAAGDLDISVVTTPIAIDVDPQQSGSPITFARERDPVALTATNPSPHCNFEGSSTRQIRKLAIYENQTRHLERW
jgi:hypothetical protein